MNRFTQKYIEIPTLAASPPVRVTELVWEAGTLAASPPVRVTELVWEVIVPVPPVFPRTRVAWTI